MIVHLWLYFLIRMKYLVKQQKHLDATILKTQSKIYCSVFQYNHPIGPKVEKRVHSSVLICSEQVRSNRNISRECKGDCILLSIQLHVNLVSCDWLERTLQMRAEWRSALEVHGVRYVNNPGITVMLLQFADSWDTIPKVRSIQLNQSSYVSGTFFCTLQMQ